MDPIPMLFEVDPRYWLIDRNPLFLAVLEDDLETLKNLLGSDKSSMNVVNSKGLSLLNWVIHRKRVDIFDFLLSLEQTDINYVDSKYGTPLTCAARFDENFALKLIEKGADIHKTDNLGNTFLHLVTNTFINNLAIGKLIIENGIDINHQNSLSETPLHNACKYKNLEWIHMLLYYGADARIYNDKGVLPLTVFTYFHTTSPNDPDEELVEDILFDYTFDVGDSVPLKEVILAMLYHSPHFCKMLRYKPHLLYNEEDLEYMADELFYVTANNFKLFFDEFGFIMKKLVQFPLLDIFIQYIRSNGEYEVKEIIETILESEFGKEFVQCSTNDAVISVFVKLYSYKELIRVTEMVCLMLSYGLRVTSADLDEVYYRYGFCELFKILLHMDINPNIFWQCDNGKRSMAAIYYQPQMTIENILERVILNPKLLLYFNNPKLKEYLTEACEDGERREVEEKIKQLPHVPCLVELSRNAARQYIIERFDVKNCRQFYTVIQSLPISRIHEEIISLERMLY